MFNWFNKLFGVPKKDRSGMQIGTYFTGKVKGKERKFRKVTNRLYRDVENGDIFGFDLVEIMLIYSCLSDLMEANSQEQLEVPNEVIQEEQNSEFSQGIYEEDNTEVCCGKDSCCQPEVVETPVVETPVVETKVVEPEPYQETKYVEPYSAPSYNSGASDSGGSYDSGGSSDSGSSDY